MNEVPISCGGDVGCVRNHHGGDGFYLHRDDPVCGRVHDQGLDDETFHDRVADLVPQDNALVSSWNRVTER